MARTVVCRTVFDLPKLFTTRAYNPSCASSRVSSCSGNLQIRYTRMDNPDAGVIVIGDEVLKGHIHDTNSRFCCQKLYSWGVRVKKVSVVADNVDEIAREVERFSREFTYVITSGGIGPTHDDVSYQGVAKGLEDRMFIHPDLLKVMQTIFPNDLKIQDVDKFHDIQPDSGVIEQIDPTLRMALVPQCSVMHHRSRSQFLNSFDDLFPVVQAKNVYILPGIPSYFERNLGFLAHVFTNPSFRFYQQEIFLRTDEISVAALLQQTVAAFEKRVSIGCYPVLYNPIYSTKLTLEAVSESVVIEASQFLQQRLPAGSVVSSPTGMNEMESTDASWAQNVSLLQDLIDPPTTTDTPLYRPVNEAVKVMKECFEKYLPEEICVCFNGGKDCTALLHLLHLLRSILKISCTSSLQAMYIICPDPFPEVEAFIEEARKRYNLQLWSVPGPVKAGLGQFLREHPRIKAMFMGNRKTDPHSGKLAPFQFTDPGWPPVMRVFPLLEWTYNDVWAFLRGFDVPYCSLYDEGYTSIDNRSNTHKNPALCRIDERGVEYYGPAYLLADAQVERNGRR